MENPQSDKITTVCVTTCDRPESLHIALGSLIHNLNKYQRNPRILIVDDSENGENIQKSKAVAQSFKQSYKGPIEYIDRTARFELAKTLSQERGVPEEVVKFALLGDKKSIMTAGSVKNLCSVKTRGEKILLADDDILYDFATLKEKNSPVFTIANPYDYWFLKQHEASPDVFEPINIDVLSLHESMLGSNISRVLGNQTPEYMKESTIIDTYMGCIGDSPMESHIPLLLLPQVYEKFKDISSVDYENAKNTDRILQSSLSSTIYQGIMSISLIMGLDNRGMIPVSTPVGRGHDLIFGTIRNKAFPLQTSGYIPIAIRHERPKTENRKIAYDPVIEFTKMDRVLSVLIAEISDVGTDPQKNLQLIGDRLLNISNEPGLLFSLLIEEQCRKITRSSAFYLESILREAYNMPDFWVNDIKSLRDALMVPNPDLFLLKLTRTPNETKENRMRLFRNWMSLYGQLLKNWQRLL